MVKSAALQLRQQRFNLANQFGQVWLFEVQLGSGDTMVFDVGRDMFVVRESRGERRIVGVRPAVVPIKFVGSLVDLVAIIYDSPSSEIDRLKNTKKDAFSKNDLAADLRRVRAGAFDHECRKLYRPKLYR